jgi:hypothetical protein
MHMKRRKDVNMYEYASIIKLSKNVTGLKECRNFCLCREDIKRLYFWEVELAYR